MKNHDLIEYPNEKSLVQIVAAKLFSRFINKKVLSVS